MSAFSHNLAEANFHRAAASGIANAERARKALEILGDDCPVIWRRVADARIGDPVAPWAEIAEQLGMAKDQAAGYFRRLVEHAEAAS